MTTATTSNPILQRSDRKTAIVVGALFLSSTATFAVGSLLITAFFSGSSPTTLLVIGVLLEIYTGLAVAGIGFAMLPLLNQHQPLARAYLGLRVLECLTIIAFGIYMLITHQQIQNYAVYIYFFTAIGGIIFSYLLYVTKLIPRPLSGLGIAGYLVLLLGIPTALLGLADLNAGWGMVFFVPGGLFELILPLWLFVYGFKVTRV
jgi:Domain of unknown function (DUF4386)